MSYPSIADLLPHAGSAILIDEVIGHDPGRIRTCALIHPEHPYFVPGRGVPVWTGIEMMAQTVGAYAGIEALAHERGKARGGMLLGTRHYRGHVPWFTAGQRLIVDMHSALDDDGGIAACEGRIEADGKVLVEATIIVMSRLPDGLGGGANASRNEARQS